MVLVRETSCIFSLEVLIFITLYYNEVPNSKCALLQQCDMLFVY